MGTDPKETSREFPREESLVARIRLKVENDGEEIAAGTRIILHTEEGNTYGFFELLNDRCPRMAIKVQEGGNPYDLSDHGVLVDYVENLGREYIAETNTPDVIDVNTVLEFVSMDKNMIRFKESGGPKHYDILETGEVNVHNDPKEDVPISEIPEPD